MELTVDKRAVGKKSATKQIRREGNIPAILYSKGEKGIEIVVNGIAFKKILNTIEKGTLSSKVIALLVDGKPIRVIVKEIQYHPTTYNIIHIDFEQLHEELPVTLNIPVVCMNAMDCAGVKLGGVIRQVIRKLKVTCLPKHIPDQFELDVRPLLMGQALKLNKLKIPDTVIPRMNLKEVAVVIAKK